MHHILLMPRPLNEVIHVDLLGCRHTDNLEVFLKVIKKYDRLQSYVQVVEFRVVNKL